MDEEPKDSEKKEKGQQFTPTDWDWVMFLSGEINAITTRSNAVWTTVIAATCACLGFLIAFLGFSIIRPGFSASNIIDDSVIIMIMIATAIIIFGGRRVLREYDKNEREAEDRVKLLKKCRNDIFNRLDDPNKIRKRYLGIVGKDDGENK